MQTRERSGECPPKSDTDGRRDTEQRADQNESRVALPPVPDMGDRTVCLSANLKGSGGVSS